MQAGMTIAALAQAGGVGVETVRYYQRRGLLGEPPRPAGGIRRYGPPDVRRLRFIRGAQSAGFSLEEIRELLALDASHHHDRARALAGARIAKIDVQIANLQAARDALAQLTRACAKARGPCPILQAFTEPASTG